MEETTSSAQTSSLKQLRGNKTPVGGNWFRRHCPWLFDWQSVFYFGVFSFLVSMAWTAYSLATNHFTQLLNWDYTWQFVPFAYDIWDDWHVLFRTGQFPLYSASTFIGTDNIGSNSYYGLFDPFIVLLAFFPRAWIPQMMVVSTFIRITVATLLMRSYLKYMGIHEWTARFGALAFGFSGYMVFMSGFPTTVAACTWFPMILWGIEIVLKERKPYILVAGLFLEGITSFFFLVVVCIWGVIYAVWRFFWDIKKRTAKQNVLAMCMGVASFAAGLMLCSFTLLPSIRETTLSGRSSSIGTAYLDAILTSLKSHDLRSFFGLVFEEVGDNPGRELMALITFFFPTGGFTQLPLAHSGGYDAWTAAIFCYTPTVILIFSGLFYSIKQNKWNHILAFVGSIFLLFTNMSYFLFYAFSGNGYGRWFIALVPEIIFYACWAFDQRKSSSRLVPFGSSVTALIMTIAVYFIIEATLKDKTFSNNFNHTTYWQSSYTTASECYEGIQGCWFLYYQIALIVIEGTLMVAGHKSKWLPKAMVIAVAVEAVVMGNLTYAYNGLWSYDNSFAGGTTARETSQVICDAINKDSSYFRTYSDTFEGSNYFSNVAGVNNSSSFHSLMNFDVEDFALNNHMKRPGSVISGSYNSEKKIYNPNWSGFYGNKRMGTDFVLGYRYYVLQNEYAAWKNEDGTAFFPASNVPFHSVELPEASPNRDRYRVYRVNEDYMPQLGWAVDSSKIYRIGHVENDFYRNAFFTNPGGTYADSAKAFLRELERVSETQLYGAIVEDDAVLPDNFTIQAVPDVKSSDSMLLSAYGLRRISVGNGLICSLYESGLNDSDGFMPSSNASYKNEGPAYFLNNHVGSPVALTITKDVKRDKGHMTFTPSLGEYFNDSYEGCYIDLKHYETTSSSKAGYNVVPRIYALGDKKVDGVIKTNQLLSFEYHCIDNMRKNDSGGHGYYNYQRSTFGLYCHGRVKQIVFCYPGTGNVPFTANNVSMVVQDYASLMGKVSKIQNDKLQDVQTYVNGFGFKTNYAEERIVVTQLGYDLGWECKAKLADGSTKQLQMLKLDGGLVGFIAPRGEATYNLYYTTPHLKVSCVLALGAIAMLAGWATYEILKTKKKKPVEASSIESDDQSSDLKADK